MQRALLDALRDVLERGGRAALATVVRASGSTPQGVGARLLLRADGSTFGTVGGGAIEAAVVEALAQCQRDGVARTFARELGHDLGMCCGGRMEVFVEPIEAEFSLQLCGAGHIGHALAPLARSIGFAVTVLDEREELNTEQRFVACRRVLNDPCSELRRAPLGQRDWLIIATHDHQLDEQLLELALGQAPHYIGLVGSKRKVFRLVERIAARRGSAGFERVYAPIGLALEAQGPEEIAVSIAAELVALKRGAPAPHMRALEQLTKARAMTHDKLAALTSAVRRDLSWLAYPERPWLRARHTSRGELMRDVLIVGGGQGGLAAAFALKRERIDNVVVFDERPRDQAGPWRNFARMRTLRTPKYLTGPDLGIPNLTPRAFYEAQHGEGSWEALGRIPKELWADYLAWYRETLSLPVESDTRVTDIAWDAGEGAYRVTASTPHGDTTTFARRVVLATGIEGSGRWQIPPFVTRTLPRERYAHTSEAIDFGALRGKRVAVLGAGASAFDNAATALEAGASEARLYFRRTQLVDVNPYRWAEFVGFLKHFGDLADGEKYAFIHQIVRMGQLPPTDTYRRAQELPGFHMHAGCELTDVALTDDGVTLITAGGRFEADFLIVGTGFVTDLTQRPELRTLAPDMARWSDRYTPPEGAAHDDLLRHPYLGEHFEFVARDAGAAPWLSYLYNYTFGGLLSLGFGGASISGMKYSVQRLTSGITRSFFLEDRAHYFDTLCNYAEREF